MYASHQVSNRETLAAVHISANPAHAHFHAVSDRSSNLRLFAHDGGGPAGDHWVAEPPPSRVAVLAAERAARERGPEGEQAPERAQAQKAWRRAEHKVSALLRAEDNLRDRLQDRLEREAAVAGFVAQPVRIVSMATRPDLRGQIGTIGKFDIERGQFTLTLAQSGERVRVTPDEVAAISADDPKPERDVALAARTRALARMEDSFVGNHSFAVSKEAPPRQHERHSPAQKVRGRAHARPGSVIEGAMTGDGPMAGQAPRRIVDVVAMDGTEAVEIQYIM